MKGNKERLRAAGEIMAKALNDKAPLPESTVAKSFKNTVKKFDDLPRHKKREFSKLVPEQKSQEFTEGPSPSNLKAKKFGFVWYLVDEGGNKVKGPYGSKLIAKQEAEND